MRYSRQELYLGKESQEVLKKKHVVLVGVGALGSVAAELLTRAGIGKLTLIDRDVVELHNLQRQSLYEEKDEGEAKVLAAKKHLERINKEVQITAKVEDITHENVELLKSDLILDGTDNLVTRFLINEYSKKNKIPWIYAAAVSDKGYVKIYLPETDCFQCTFTETTGLDSCDTAGVLNTLTHTVASIQVTEAFKVLLQKVQETPLFHLNIWENSLTRLKTQRKEGCEVCKGNYNYLMGKKEKEIIKFCGSGSYQIKGKVKLEEIKEKLEKLGKVESFEHGIQFNQLMIFKDGRVLIKAKDEKEAKSLYAQYIGE
tara:strand:- start:37428 stop:38372 length:945 start_codon:yes stop_codon:yes gene_type:complete